MGKDKPCKHRFEPRYSRVWTTDIEQAAKSKARWRNLDGDAYLQSETYVYDVCVKCGVKV